MAVLKREDFRAKINSRPTIVGKLDCPLLGGEVCICKLSAGGRDRVTAAMLNLGKKGGEYRARLLIETVCDDTGARLFTEDDLAWLSTLDHDLLEPIFDEAQRLNKTEDKSEGDPAKN